MLKSYKNNGINRIQVTEAPVKKINERYRSQVMILSDTSRDDEILPLVYEAVRAMYNDDKYKYNKELVANIDINPQQLT